MKKRLKITILLSGILLFLASCRAGDCGCPMSMEEDSIDSVGVALSNSDADQDQEINSSEFRPHYYQRSGTW